MIFQKRDNSVYTTYTLKDDWALRKLCNKKLERDIEKRDTSRLEIREERRDKKR